MNTYKFWIDKGEQKSREDLTSGFDFNCQAEDRYGAEYLFLNAMEKELHFQDNGNGVTVFHSCNDKGWHKIFVRQPPTSYVLNWVKPITLDQVHDHFEVDL